MKKLNFQGRLFQDALRHIRSSVIPLYLTQSGILFTVLRMLVVGVHQLSLVTFGDSLKHLNAFIQLFAPTKG